MCGIIGYFGPRPVAEVLLDGLERLEYRGYDSAGIALVDDSPVVQIMKKAGKIHQLKDVFYERSNGVRANCGVGHTRWATHGIPSDTNAHPHCDCTGQVAVVHNGIIENYTSLRRELGAAGHHLVSETDTEVIPHLIEENFAGDLPAAVRATTAQLQGSYALAVISASQPETLVAVRQDSPLVIGLGDGEYWVASDIPALLPYTRRIFFLENGEMAVITSRQVEIFNASGSKQERDVFHVNWEGGAAARNGYPHFMLKEIFEQPLAIQDTTRGRLTPRGIELPELERAPVCWQQVRQISVVACGTAYHAGLVGGQLMEQKLRLPVRVELASEFRSREPLIDAQTLVIAISQSGETADTLAAVRLAKEKGARVVAITNVMGSSISREADATLYTRAGPEIAVASTKAYLTQLVALDLLYLWLARRHNLRVPTSIFRAEPHDRGGAAISGTKTRREQQLNFNPELAQQFPASSHLSFSTSHLYFGADAREMEEALSQLPGLVEQVLRQQDRIQKIADYVRQYEDAYFIGRGLDYAVAAEGALKLKEISYIHAESLAAGELKHGTLALITPGVPVVGLCTQPALFAKTVNNFKEVKARGGHLIVLTQNVQIMEGITEEIIPLPATLPELMPVLTVVPLQLLAYFTAVARGCDVDQPRNLAKSVTVE